MGDEVILKDDGYDELAGVFNKDSEIPGDEITGIIGEADSDKGEEDDDSTAGDTNDGTDNTDDTDSGAAEAANDSDEEDLGEGDADTEDAGEADTDDGSADTDTEGEEETTDEGNETDLRAQLREQQRKVALTEAKLDTMSRQQKADKDAVADEDNEDDIATSVEPSNLEAHQLKLNDLAETRGEVISDMLEFMKVNPKYEDVEEVCSKNNLDDTIETLARAQVAKEGGDLVEIMMGLEVDIWSQRNPYSYMYGLIKDIHPSYKESKKTDETGGKEGDTSKDGKKKKTPKKAPLSALDLARGGGGKNVGEWTAEKIDNLNEAELSKVPKDVYKQYMRGDLDK